MRNLKRCSLAFCIPHAYFGGGHFYGWQSDDAGSVGGGGTCILVVGMMLWLALDISYKFREDHLYLRVGFLFTCIRYEDIESYRHHGHHLEEIRSSPMIRRRAFESSFQNASFVHSI